MIFFLNHLNLLFINILISLIMTKQIFRLFAIIAIVGLAFTGCQKENLVDEKTTENKGVAVDAEKSYPILKGGFVSQKTRTVYIPSSFTNDYTYTSLKIKDSQGRYQEWLFVDLKTDGIPDYWNQTGDNDGTTYGFYYQWQETLSTFLQSDWDQVVFSDINMTTNITGFHVPVPADIDKLAQIVGSTSKIRSTLALNYDGAKNYGPDYSTDFAAMWVNKPGDPNIVPGCGVFLQWKRYESDRMYYFYSNIDYLGINVRLVRDLPVNEW